MTRFAAFTSGGPLTRSLRRAASALALSTLFATMAFARESAHVSLGIVGSDDPSLLGGGGVRVIEVFGPRAGRDLRRGDRVIRVDGRRVRDGDELRDVLRDRHDDAVSIVVLRHGHLRRVRALRLVPDVVDGDVLTDGDRMAIRRVVRDVRRDVLRDVRRHRVRNVRIVSADREELREALRGLRKELHELELRLEAETWR